MSVPAKGRTRFHLILLGGLKQIHSITKRIEKSSTKYIFFRIIFPHSSKSPVLARFAHKATVLFEPFKRIAVIIWPLFHILPLRKSRSQHGRTCRARPARLRGGYDEFTLSLIFHMGRYEGFSFARKIHMGGYDEFALSLIFHMGGYDEFTPCLIFNMGGYERFIANAHKNFPPHKKRRAKSPAFLRQFYHVSHFYHNRTHVVMFLHRSKFRRQSWKQAYTEHYQSP